MGVEWTKTPNFERLAERCVTLISVMGESALYAGAEGDSYGAL